MTHDIEKLREEFQKLAIEKGFTPTLNERGDYAFDEERNMWEGFQMHAALQEAKPASALSEQYSDMLRELCCFLSVGGYNSEGLMPPEMANKKIRDGISNLLNPVITRKDDYRSRLIEALEELDAIKINPDHDLTPVAWMHEDLNRFDVIHVEVKKLWLGANPQHVEKYTIPLMRKDDANMAANIHFGEYYRNKFEAIKAKPEAAAVPMSDDKIITVWLNVINKYNRNVRVTYAQADFWLVEFARALLAANGEVKQ